MSWWYGEDRELPIGVKARDMNVRGAGWTGDVWWGMIEGEAGDGFLARD